MSNYIDYLYCYSDGKVTNNRANLFNHREDLIIIANSVVENINKSDLRKLTGKDFEYAWLNDPNVKYYRNLLHEIWNFKTDVFLVKTIIKCHEQKCDITTDLWVVKKEWYGQSTETVYLDTYFLCDEHKKKLDDHIEYMNKRTTIESDKYKKIFEQKIEGELTKEKLLSLGIE